MRVAAPSEVMSTHDGNGSRVAQSHDAGLRTGTDGHRSMVSRQPAPLAHSRRRDFHRGVRRPASPRTRRYRGRESVRALANRPSREHGTRCAHGANGNRVAESTTGLTRSFDHDSRGTLRRVTVGGTEVRYTVDGSGRRIARQENGTTTAQWLYRDGLRMAAELDGQGALRWRFVYATGKHVPHAAIGADGTVYRLVTDQVGSLRLVVRASDGSVMQRMRHDAWGKVEEDFVEAGFARVPFGFAGWLVDQVTGLVLSVHTNVSVRVPTSTARGALALSFAHARTPSRLLGTTRRRRRSRRQPPRRRAAARRKRFDTRLVAHGVPA
jgi:hypothetical protein